ncbi:MAG: Hsp20/alpha crystallin family protein [Candidatus Limnocylindrales bacterium]
MTIVRRASPLGELVSLRQAMDRLFEDSFVRPRGWVTSAFEGYGLPLDVTSGTDAINVEASLPGFKPEDVQITIENGTLNIQARTESETKEGEGEALVTEIRRGSVSRTITLPAGLEPDKATATYEHGMLKLRIPKADAVKPRQVRITPTSDGTSTNGSNGSKHLASGEASAETAVPAGA